MVGSHYGSLSTCAQAGVVFQRYIAIGCVTLATHSQGVLHSLNKTLCAQKVACRPPAHFNDVSAGRGEPEVCIESGYGPDVIDGDTLTGSYLINGLGRDVAELLLNSEE